PEDGRVRPLRPLGVQLGKDRQGRGPEGADLTGGMRGPAGNAARRIISGRRGAGPAPAPPEWARRCRPARVIGAARAWQRRRRLPGTSYVGGGPRGTARRTRRRSRITRERHAVRWGASL